jgi:NitT/TauT family transport system permease protein
VIGLSGVDQGSAPGIQSVLRTSTGASRGSLRSVVSTEQIAVRAMQIGFFAFVFALWWLISHLDLGPPLLSRTPEQVWNFMREEWVKGVILGAAEATLFAMFVAFFLASAVGIVIGIALGLMGKVEAVINPFLDALNSMPRIAFAPVFVLYFGITTSAKVALAFTVVVFILIYNARAGVRSADGDWMRLSRVLGATNFQLFYKIMLPVSVPSIFAGLRLGLIYALLGVVTSEIIASRVGLGQLINAYSSTFKMEGVYGILIILAVVGLALNSMMAGLERWILRWQQPSDL